MTFSIIVVCMNAGEKLHETIKSILSQTETDYEVVIKDGGSTDGSLEALEPNEKFRVYSMPDEGIYDAMNQAIRRSQGDYICFLNCGDYFYDEMVLQRVKNRILHKKSSRPVIFYGNIYERKTGAVVQSNPVLDEFARYRNLPCHQACFYERELFAIRVFDTTYRVRADYEHFMWSLYKKNARAVYMPFTAVSYEGGGYSESKEGRRRSGWEHRQIVAKYMSKKKVWQYRMIMLLTLSPLRTWAAENPATAGMYQKIKKKIYKGRRQSKAKEKR